MRGFMDENFLLETQTAQTQYHDYAEGMPIIDYHCHINPREIFENRRFENLTQAWLEGDHYKWRAIRSNGVPEEFITGKADDKEKFLKYAQALPKAIGNPLYHWSHLELKRYLGIETPLSGDTAGQIWEQSQERMADGKLSVRAIIEQSGVEAIGTTDDPLDNLSWHAAIRDDDSCKVKVVPTFRPDKAVNVEKAGFSVYINALGEAVGVTIKSLDDLKDALSRRLDFFVKMGCRASDHGLDSVVFRPDPEHKCEKILMGALDGNTPTHEEAEIFKTALMLFLGRELHKRGLVMQLHYGVIRNTNTRLNAVLGPDTGFDCIGQFNCASSLSGFLDALDYTNQLPRTILYSINPGDDAVLGAMLGCFQDSAIPGKLQHGSAWWFNDTRDGMERQMRSLASLSLLGNFVGMLTDSRSFMSYTRHEYFRRILCNMLGRWVENGEYPADIPALGQMVRGISCDNARRYFNL